MMALSLLPLNAAGIALLLLGLVLMVGEALAPGIGILGIGGVIAFMLGSLLLFDPAGADIDFSVAWPVALSATLTSALLIMGLLGFIFQARRRKVRTGAEELIGLEGRVVSWKTEEGRIRIHGEIWSARSSHQLKPGQAVSVDQRQGLTLVVSPIKERT
jgi:membrane-bound serine protease (ClpP class)